MFEGEDHSHGEESNVPDRDIKVREFERQSGYYVYFQTYIFCKYSPLAIVSEINWFPYKKNKTKNHQQTNKKINFY